MRRIRRPLLLNRPLYITALTLHALHYIKVSRNCCLAWSTSSSLSRKEFWARATAISNTIAILSPPQQAVAAKTNELPSLLKPFTKLAPLGSPTISPDKTTNQTLSQLAHRLERALVYGDTGQGGYFLTGDLPTDIFRDDCVFIDPTNSVSSTSQYQTALRVLFDPKESTVRLLSPLSISEEERTITATIQSHGILQLPWRPIVKAYESTIVYKVDNNGLIFEQLQTWSKSASEALKESFTPNVFGTAPKSTLQATEPNEPLEVTRLFDIVNGRRPTDYSPSEQLEIDSLVASIVEQHYPWKRELLPGKWILVYLQPGPNGGGIDRRIPFPEFDFNDSYQVFGLDSVVNIGEVFGPNLRVEVGGDLTEADTTSLQVPKRFIANIFGGKLCAFENACVSLPISGEGLFDGVYLGERLRIGQNINGGGARVVQLRLE